MCDCYEQVNEKLAEYNTQLNPSIAISDNTFKFMGVRVETLKIDSTKRGKPMSMVATYCPFCGTKYRE